MFTAMCNHICGRLHATGLFFIVCLAAAEQESDWRSLIEQSFLDMCNTITMWCPQYHNNVVHTVRLVTPKDLVIHLGLLITAVLMRHFFLAEFFSEKLKIILRKIVYCFSIASRQHTRKRHYCLLSDA